MDHAPLASGSSAPVTTRPGADPTASAAPRATLLELATDLGVRGDALCRLAAGLGDDMLFDGPPTDGLRSDGPPCDGLPAGEMPCDVPSSAGSRDAQGRRHCVLGTRLRDHARAVDALATHLREAAERAAPEHAAEPRTAG